MYTQRVRPLQVRLWPYITYPQPMSAHVCMPYMGWLRLRGARLAVGQIVLPVGRFSVHSWFPFQSPPTPPIQPPAPVLLHVEHNRVKTLCAYISVPLSAWPFSGRPVTPLLPHQYPHAAHTAGEYCVKARGPTLNTNAISWQGGKSLFLFGNLKELFRIKLHVQRR